ncbi:hypothetical protein TWF481_008744 [Arthrobotrys musiformis]|uniref:Sas10 C-terminal domain-containing protein n=1 Tax=Arthrobotrys musiformis TaxID=47236 RepID=A0AAV9WAG3_9PEZI
MAVATPPSLATLLSTLTTSLTSTAASLPVAPPQSGLSLLDIKNDIFLSYLHHLSYLLLFRIKNRSLGGVDTDAEELLGTLATLRLWLEKGVKPCENKLKYQVEKVLKAASEWEREKIRLENAKEEASSSEDDGDEDGSEDEDDEEIDSDEEITSESDTDLPKTLNYDSDDSKPRKTSAPVTASLKNALSYRPNPSSLSKPAAEGLPSKSEKGKEGIYKPPKLNPVVMPSATPNENYDPDAKPRGGERKQKARVIDEYLASMPGAAPIAEPSIGSNVGRLGRTKTAREREEERERRDYEESNFVRLPSLSKKEKREKSRREAGRGREWGGEDWGSLEKGMGLDRIERLTKRKDGGGMLARSRKRGADVEGEARIGERFEKRRKVVDRDRRRRG